MQINIDTYNRNNALQYCVKPLAAGRHIEFMRHEYVFKFEFVIIIRVPARAAYG